MNYNPHISCCCRIIFLLYITVSNEDPTSVPDLAWVACSSVDIVASERRNIEEIKSFLMLRSHCWESSRQWKDILLDSSKTPPIYWDFQLMLWR
jgi:hypothetical protein